MAFSQLATKGQSALVCQLCENEPKIKWKCMECALMMCQRCRDKVHPKFPSAEDHTIIDIKDIGKQQIDSGEKLYFANLKCRSHVGQRCCLFCESCVVLVCPSCITNTHKKHELIDINVGYKTKVAQIKARKEHFEKEVKTILKREEEFRKIKYQCQVSINGTKQEITDYEKAVVAAVKKNTHELLQEVDEEGAIVMTSITAEENEVMKTRKTLVEQIGEVTNLLLSGNIEKVFAISEAFLKLDIITIKPTRKFKPPSKFVPGNISNISSKFGSLKYDAKIKHLAKDDKLLIEQSITTQFKDVTNIVVCEDGSFWLNDVNAEILHKVQVVDNSVKTVSKFDCLCVAGMVLASSGDIYLSVLDCCILKIIPSGTTELKDTSLGVSPLQPMSICLTNENKFVIGAKPFEEDFISGNSSVVVMDHFGQEEATIRFDSQNKPLFSGVLGIASSSTNDVAVLDLLSENGLGRIVIMDIKGHVNNAYAGHPDLIEKDQVFRPRAIASTKSDYFIVADYWHNVLHILNNKGEFVTFYDTAEKEIGLPWSLCVSGEGQLCIGCSTYKDNDTSKVYITKRMLV